MKPLREQYHHELVELERELAALGKLVDSAVQRSIWALKQGALSEAQAIIQHDDVIDDAADAIIQHAMHVIATQAPVAGELRLVGSFIQAADELERIGDYAEGIARLVLRFGGPVPCGIPPEIEAMATASRGMLAQALTAISTRDPTINLRLKEEDDVVDAAYERLLSATTRLMESDPAMVTPGIYLIWVGHNLERMGDRATNIAEYADYIVSGVKHTRHE